MKTSIVLGAIVLLLMFTGKTVCAQESGDRHPYLDARYMVSAGAFLNKKKLKLDVRGTRDSSYRTVDFGDSWGLDSAETSFAGEFRWRFGDKWSLATQYFETNDKSRATMTEDITWGDYTLLAGTNVGAGVGAKVARMLFGRKISEGPKHELGAGLGLHWMEINAFVDGELYIDNALVGDRRESVKASAPLPNLGLWYYRALSSRWLVVTRLDWLSASFEEYSGSLFNGSIGINFMPFDNFGVSLAYNHFNLNVDVDKSDWKGGADLTYRGPFVSITAAW